MVKSSNVLQTNLIRMNTYTEIRRSYVWRLVLLPHYPTPITYMTTLRMRKRLGVGGTTLGLKPERTLTLCLTVK